MRNPQFQKFWLSLARVARQQGAIPLKTWVVEESMRIGARENTIRMHVRRGKYPHLNLRRINKRVVFVFP